jgi:aldose 1-epimerase
MTGSQLSSESFGETPDGSPATLHTLRTAKLRARVTNYGGRLVSIETPDRDGKAGEVLLGFDDVACYARAGGAFGALLGRSANRIAGGAFSVDGQAYRLPVNDRGNTLHGGPLGFDKVHWKVTAAIPEPHPTLVLAHVSRDGDQGFPGELSVTATYRLEMDCLWLTFEARTSKATLVSLSAHPYFNLAGPASGCALGALVTVFAEAFLPTDRQQIPTGEIRSVEGTPFDFRQPTMLRARIRQPDEQLLFGQGYDHYFVLAQSPSDQPRLAARALDPGSGRLLELHTTQPGLQLYTGNHLDGSIAGRGGAYRQSAGFAFEAQGFPDAPHHPDFPSTFLRPGEIYRQCIGYRFSVSD